MKKPERLQAPHKRRRAPALSWPQLGKPFFDKETMMTFGRILTISIATGTGLALAAVAVAVERHQASMARPIAPVRASAPSGTQAPIVPADALTPTETDWVPRTGDAAN